ncbi:MAG: MFS transporter [Puniceicoccales bacterium]|jgi:MFS family permease|nr:MFS transporter [Puniceicoccales bacterium]
MRAPSPEIQPSPPKPANRRALGLIFLTVFMDILGFSIIIPIYPKLLTHYLAAEGNEGTLVGALVRFADWLGGGVGNEFVTAALFGGLLGSVYSLLQFVFAPMWGKLSDRCGRRPVLLITLAGTALAYLTWVFAGAFWVVVVARVILGVVTANISVATAAAADMTSGKERAKGMALVGVAFALAFLVGPAMGGFSAQWEWAPIGVRSTHALALNPFSFSALIAFVLAAANWFFAWRYFKETLPPEKRTVPVDRASIFELGRVSSPGIKRATLTNFLFTVAFSGTETVLVFATAELFGYQPHDNAWVFIFNGIFLIIAQGFIVRRFVNKVGERNLVLLGLASGVVAFLLIAATQNDSVSAKFIFYTAMVFFAFSVGLIQSSLSALVSLYSNSGEQGRNLGVFRSAGAFARVFGPLLAALIYFKCGGHTWVYIAGAIVTMIPLAFAVTLPQPRHDEGAA